MTKRLAGFVFSVAIAAFPAIAQEPKLIRTEVVVLADLSNRIDSRLNPGQLGRDTTVLRIVAEEFSSVVKRNRYLFSRDRLRAMYVGGETPPTEPRVDVARMNQQRRVVVRELAAEVTGFLQAAAVPYRQVRREYVGADLWSWFKHSAGSSLSVEDVDRVVKNRIIILTDGYLEFAPSVSRDPGTAMRMSRLRKNPDWQAIYPAVKLKPVGFKFPPDSKILMLELAPLRPTVNTSEQEILERYWRDWFAEMGATVEFHTTAEAMPSIRDAITRFLK